MLSKRYYPLLQRYRCYRLFLHREFSKTRSIDDQQMQNIEKRNIESSIHQERNQRENIQKSNKNIKVCIIGGGVTPLYTAILLKQYQIIKSINFVDTRDFMAGTLAEICHMETCPRVNYFRKKDLKNALKEVNIVALMDETDTAGDMITNRVRFKSATDYVCQTTYQILRFCPDALIAVFVRPVTATLAMVSEIFRCSGWWNPDHIIGSTAAYKMQIEETTAALLNLENLNMSVPLAGGADSCTVVPLLSRAVPFNQFTNAQRESLLQSLRIGDEKTTVESVDDNPSLSSGAAAAKLIITLATGLCGFEHVITCAYVRSNILPVCRFFTSQLQLGPEGVKRNLGLPKISPMEVLLIEQAIPLINEYTDMAITAVQSKKMRAKT